MASRGTYLDVSLGRFYRPSKSLNVVLVMMLALFQACANAPRQPVLDDLKSRYWKGTYYLSVKESPTSIKCSVDPDYPNAQAVPVIYKSQDATMLFTTDEDQEKIKALQQQCFEKSKEVFPSKG